MQQRIQIPRNCIELTGVIFIPENFDPWARCFRQERTGTHWGRNPRFFNMIKTQTKRLKNWRVSLRKTC